jgi:hypothetical protein
LQILILIATVALPPTDEPVPPLVRLPDVAEGSRLLLVLPPQFFDLALEIFVPLQHAPQRNVCILRQQVGVLPQRALAAVPAVGTVLVLAAPAAVDLLLEPDVLLQQILVFLLALLQVVEFLSCTVLALAA